MSAACNSIQGPTTGGLRSALKSCETRVHLYDYQAKIEDGFTWNKLLAEGELLLSGLMSLHLSDDSSRRPLVLICHSLGGFIAKQALIIAKQHADRYGDLIKAISGVILLGCPHGARQLDNLRESVSLILRSAGCDSRKVLAPLEESVDVLQEVALQFDPNTIPYLVSVYEEKSTFLDRNGLFGRAQHVVLVNKRLTMINALSDMSGWKDGRISQLMEMVLKHALGSHSRELTSSLPSTGSQSSMPRRKDSVVTHKRAARLDKVVLAVSPVIQKFAAELPCFMVEIRLQNRDFCNREAILSQLNDVLLPDGLGSNVSTRHAAIIGPPGQGKSEIAIHWAFTRRRRFDAIFWIQADNESKLQKDFARIAPAVGLVSRDNRVSDTRTVQDVQNIATEWLKDPILDAHANGADAKRANWLLIFDNADDPHILHQLWPVFASGAVLVTTRDPNISDVLSKGQVNINLPPFSEEEGVLALKQLAHLRPADERVQRREDQLARQISIRLGGWPLGISQMAGIIRHDYMSLTEFHERYQDIDERREFHNRADRDLRGTSRGTMASMIISDFLSAQARVLLEICSMLDPDSISEHLFTNPCPEIRLLRDFPADRPAYYRARAELVQLSLIRLTDKREIGMHRYVQEIVVSKLSRDGFEAVFTGTASLISTAWGESSLEDKSRVRLWGDCARLIPHVHQLQIVYQERPQGQDVKPFAGFAWLLTQAAWWHFQLGNTRILEATLKLARTVCDHLPLSENLDVLSDVYHLLGGWANETNHPKECLEYNSIYLQLRLDALKRGEKPSMRTAAAYNQKGTGWMMVKEYEMAKQDFRTSREMYRDLPEYHRTMASLPIVNLACAEWMTGNLDEADRLLREGLAEREEEFGVDDRDSFKTGRFLHTFGNVRFDQAMLQPAGDEREQLLEDSNKFHKRALAQYVSIIGTHHRTADVSHRVAEHYLRKEDTVSAKVLIDQALKTWNVDAGSFTPEIARTTFLKAKCAALAGHEDEAEDLRRQAADIRATLVPEDKRNVHDLKAEDFDELVAFWSR